MPALWPQVIVAHKLNGSEEGVDVQHTPAVSAQLGMGLVVSIDLIDPLLKKGAKDLDRRLEKHLAKGRLHLQQWGGQILQQWVEHYVEFLGERLV